MVSSVKILEFKNNELRFIVEGSNHAFSNALRRIMISEVPVMAISEFVIINNTSPVYDEILVHRLSLIPLTTDLESFNLPEKCVCNGVGCSRCQVTLILNVKADDEPKTVYSRDITSSDPRVVPVSDDFPLTKLSVGDEIVIEMYARLGRGKENARFQPVSVCVYKYMPRVIVDTTKCVKCRVDELLTCVNACFKGALNVNEEKGYPYLRYPLNCNLCNSCVEACEYRAIKLDADDKTFIFYIESTGALSPTKIVYTAATILAEKCDEFLIKIKEVI
ncbi:MAG: DNA-directed RNA polymerase subunit D [Candidatus Methanomethylicia archaeon]|nr:DNA-directed RNA polymerase subunit D [Candidatus Methanomethylicia archaeon]MCX8169083.1 DNA-directed RNA polymerase subunit D [Candidatus Methanomethylicia archaeon]MDW7988815.1 DNA-directed RNA polymerase subunit D [Nitrososphaerota archaeon]